MPKTRKSGRNGNSNKNNTGNRNTNANNNRNNNSKKLYPRLKLSFEEAQAWLIDHLSSDVFKRRENAQNTLSSIPKLQEIVSNGMITENSQEGVINKGYNDYSKKFYEIRERAYLSGFMRHKAALKLVDYINMNTDKVAFIIAIVPLSVSESIRASGINIALTTQASAKKVEDIQDFEVVSVAPQFIDKEGFEFMKTLSNLRESEEVDLVMIFDPKYGRLASSVDGLYADVLTALTH